MNVSDRELSKKPKIIEIGSEKKKLQPLKVDDISKKSENLKMFVREIQVLLQKLSRLVEFLRIVKKFSDCFSLSFTAIDITFGIL